MRPAGRQRTEVIPIAPTARVSAQPPHIAATILEKLAPNLPRSADDHRAARLDQLAIAIEQRIKSRLAGRIRELLVHVNGDTIVIDGRCATYYTKQLAQHAALGILEDELLENAIVVGV